MKTTTNLKTDRVEETHRGLAGIGQVRRVLNQVITEVANGSRKLPIAVYQSVDMTVYQIHYQGAWLTVQVTEKVNHPLTAQTPPSGGRGATKGGAL